MDTDGSRQLPFRVVCSEHVKNDEFTPSPKQICINEPVAERRLLCEPSWKNISCVPNHEAIIAIWIPPAAADRKSILHRSRMLISWLWRGRREPGSRCGVNDAPTVGAAAHFLIFTFIVWGNGAAASSCQREIWLDGCTWPELSSKSPTWFHRIFRFDY